MKNLFILMIILFTNSTINAQYYYFEEAGAFQGSLNLDPAVPAGSGQSAGWVSIVGPSATTPIWSANQTLPFPFDFNGAPVTDYKISSTGVLTFTTSATVVPGTTPTLLPDSSIPDNSICIWGLNASGSNDNGSIKVFGSAPNRQLWIHYSSCSNGSIGASYLSIVLIEGTNQIFVVDQRNNSGTGALTVGIQIDGSTAVNVTGSPSLGAQAGQDETTVDDYIYEFIPGAVLPTNEIRLDALNLGPFVVPGNLNIQGTVRNLGSTPITQFGVTYDAGAGPQVDNITGVSIPPYGTSQFSHSTPLNAIAGTNYSLDLSVGLTGDVDLTNNQLVANTFCLTSAPVRTVVGEERTGTWCGFCPRGAVGLAEMESTPNFIGIAIHNNDPMAFSAYDNGISNWIPNSFPTGAVDRMIIGDPSDFDSLYNARVNNITPCNVDTVIVNNDGTNLSVSTNVTFFGPVEGKYRLSLVMTEDDVIGGTSGAWMQTNYYGNGTIGPLTDPVSMFDWAAAGSPVNPTVFGGYDHVARTLSSNNVLGDLGSLPSGSIPVGTYNYTFADIPITNFDDLTKVHPVVMIVDTITGEVLNAGGLSAEPVAGLGIDELEYVTLYSIYPNPSIGLVYISFTLMNQADVSVQITDAMGNVIHNQASQILFPGEHNAKFNANGLASGMYLVNLVVEGQVITKRLTLVN